MIKIVGGKIHRVYANTPKRKKERPQQPVHFPEKVSPFKKLYRNLLVAAGWKEEKDV